MQAVNTIYSPLTPIKRAVLIAIGTLTLGVGILGIFVPGLPTTVFLLITLACYTRSSERAYTWVITRPWLQKPLRAAFNYRENGTIPVRVKWIAQGFAWASVFITIFSNARPFFQIFTLLFAIACSVAMALIRSEEQPISLRSWRMTAGDIARQLAIGAASGAFAGLIWGLGGRLIMRFVANIADKAPQFNLQLTLMMLIGTTVLGLLVGLLYAAVRRALPQNKWLRGVLFGLGIMFTLGTALYLTSYMQADIARVGLEWRELIVALFVPNFIIFGIVAALTFRSLERKVLTH
jgi:uncharacterized membrane protein YbaN (DUF454 family)